MGYCFLRVRTSREEIHRLVSAAAVHVLDDNQPSEWRVFCYQYGGEPQGRTIAGQRCWYLALGRLSFVEVLAAPWHTEPHARQRCVEHVELDADDYPGGDPQNGQ